MEQAAEDHAALLRHLGRTAGEIEATMREDLDEALQGCDPLLREVVEHALFSGGKRIRPQLAVMSAELCGAAGRSTYRQAIAFEYLHVATLIHDDVIDKALERRGRPSVVSRFGITAAILAGDWLHARSMHLVGRYAGAEGLELFCRSTAGMVDGEFLQLRFTNDWTITREQYFEVVRRKTGLLIASTCEIGALSGGGDPARRQALAAYGDKLGIAFQVIDDLLDYQGDQARTGKKTGNDYFEGKVTLPLILALEAADDDDRQGMLDLLCGPRDAAGLEQVSEFIRKNEGFARARAVGEQLISEAVAALDIFCNHDGENIPDLLRALAGFVLNRDR